MWFFCVVCDHEWEDNMAKKKGTKCKKCGSKNIKKRSEESKFDKEDLEWMNKHWC